MYISLYMARENFEKIFIRFVYPYIVYKELFIQWINARFS